MSSTTALNITLTKIRQGVSRKIPLAGSFCSGRSPGLTPVSLIRWAGGYYLLPEMCYVLLRSTTSAAALGLLRQIFWAAFMHVKMFPCRELEGDSDLSRRHPLCSPSFHSFNEDREMFLTCGGWGIWLAKLKLGEPLISCLQQMFHQSYKHSLSNFHAGYNCILWSFPFLCPTLKYSSKTSSQKIETITARTHSRVTSSVNSVKKYGSRCFSFNSEELDVTIRDCRWRGKGKYPPIFMMLPMHRTAKYNVNMFKKTENKLAHRHDMKKI